MPQPERWHRADFILRGDYCPAIDVHRQIADIRQILSARMLMHIAVDHEVVLRSLNWASGEPERVTAALSQWLTHANYRDEHADLNRTLVAMARRTAKQTVARIPGSVAEALANTLASMSAPTSLESFGSSGWDGYILNHTGREGIAPRAGEVSSILLFTRASTSPTFLRSAFDDLGVMLKCTFEAASRRDGVVMNQVASRLHVQNIMELDFHAMAGTALDLAIGITESTAGAIYLVSPRGTDTLGLALQAQSSNEHDTYDEYIPFDLEKMIWQSIHRHRAYQHLGKGHRSNKELRPTLSGDHGVELVTPIAGPLADTLEHAIGAITLHKEKAPHGYSAYERSLIRNVGLRLALIRTSMATRDMADAISELRSTSPLRFQRERTAAKITTNDRPQLPEDILIAISRFGEPLRKLAECTQSHSVSLRIALPDKTVNGHGLSLTRVAIHPPDLMAASAFMSHKEGDPGPHWEVIRSGTAEYAPDTRSDARYPEGRPNTRSALCVPVPVEGIVVGTLNLESPLADSYAAFMPMVVALCGAIGRTLADGRAYLEAEILDDAANALTKKHDFIGDLRELRQKIEGTQAPASSIRALIEQVEPMESIIHDLREPRARTSVSESIWEILVKSAGALHMNFGRMREPEDDIFHLPINPAVAETVSTIFRCLLTNINRHSNMAGYDADGQPTPRAEFSTTTLQGSQQAVIALENYSLQYLSHDACRELYRYPVPGREGELRLGTYIAGLNARRAGARVHACVLDDFKTFRTTLILPVGELT